MGAGSKEKAVSGLRALLDGRTVTCCQEVTIQTASASLITQWAVRNGSRGTCRVGHNKMSFWGVCRIWKYIRSAPDSTPRTGSRFAPFPTDNPPGSIRTRRHDSTNYGTDNLEPTGTSGILLSCPIPMYDEFVIANNENEGFRSKMQSNKTLLQTQSRKRPKR